MITQEQAESKIFEKENLQFLVAKWEIEIDEALLIMVEEDGFETLIVLPDNIHPLVKKTVIRMYMPHWKISLHTHIKNGLIFRRK